MKIVHSIPNMAQQAAGPSYSVPRLCSALADHKNEVTLLCLSINQQLSDVSVRISRQWQHPRKFEVSFEQAALMREYSQSADIFHNHSLWSMVNVATGLIIPGKKAKLVTSPRGTLTDWSMAQNGALKKFLWPFQKLALSKADLIHVTSADELKDVRRHGFNAPVAVIPNGIDIPDLIPKQGTGDQRTLLFLGRVHPTKNIESLLRAWALVQDKIAKWELKIVGVGDDTYLAKLKQLARSLTLRRCVFSGPAYGNQKGEEYRAASLFVLPSHSENFGMVVAEALAQECPVIANTGAPWQGLIDQDCGWWIKNDTEILAAAILDAATKEPGRLATMGTNGRIWMKREFSWSHIGQMMNDAYQWTLDKDIRTPSFIDTIPARGQRT